MPRNVPTDRARALRANDTRAEARLWEVLRNRRLGGWKWRRQVPVGAYIVDFLCLENRLVIELDGAQHADAVAYDERRTAFLQTQGFTILRFWNHAVFEGREGVCDAILEACGGESPNMPDLPNLPD
ncbi:endonuclease domain-containing protein [Phenylobacterium sp. LH3H17]|uniref:endonuclease domain-containing protein n=1 Tax=Phenylobacterium sp. LH3H17 TaxID=2903901 RepID=UPI0020C9E673|nr:endonuclease domain-containing protein [Phenylobacterium sp. LH3H17]UTP39885.1 endonuclease domain-containing protein [Phenylobacterium sp. LH3H17]